MAPTSQKFGARNHGSGAGTRVFRLREAEKAELQQHRLQELLAQSHSSFDTNLVSQTQSSLETHLQITSTTLTMLRRQPTRITLDMSDVTAYEERSEERQKLKEAEMRAQQQERMMQENVAVKESQNPNPGGALGQTQGQGNRQKSRNERLGLGSER